MLLLFKFHKYFFSTVLLFWFTNINASVFAQLQVYHLLHFGENEGLIQNSITALIPDNNDFITIGTQGGICKFNGFLFTPLTNAANTNIKINNPARTTCLLYKGTDTILAYNHEKDLISTLYHYRILTTEKYDIQKHGRISARLNTTLPCPEFVKAGKRVIVDSFLKEILTIRNHYDYILPCHKDTIAVIKTGNLHFFTNSGPLKNISIHGLIPEDSYYINAHPVIIDSKKNLSFISTEGLQRKTALKFLNKYNNVKYVTDISASGIYIIADNDLLWLTIDQHNAISIKYI